jgi:hypothetical protein
LEVVVPVQLIVLMLVDVLHPLEVLPLKGVVDQDRMDTLEIPEDQVEDPLVETQVSLILLKVLVQLAKETTEELVDLVVE